LCLKGALLTTVTIQYFSTLSIAKKANASSLW
jgi:hypothetical protein